MLDNIIYAAIVCKMVNAAAEQENYWTANNIIWGLMLIPISALVNLIYYPVIYGLMSKGIFQPDITFICVMFGFGMVTHLVCSVICFGIYKKHLCIIS